MTFVATTTVSIFRGTIADEYGDDKDADIPIATEVPASIIERSRRAFVPVDGQDRVVRYARGRFSPAQDIREGDRVRDKNGVTYVVEETVNPGSPYSAGQLRAEMKRVS